MALSYDQWMKEATSSAEASIPANSDGVLHVGERAALVEQLSYLKKRNAQLMKQQRAVLLAACEAQAAHAQCADFAGELMRAQIDNGEEKDRRKSTNRAQEDITEKLQRLEHENAELLRKTAVLVDYVRATAPMPRKQGFGRDDDDDDYSDDDDDEFENDDKELPPKANQNMRFSCLPQPVAFDHFASRHMRQCKWESFMAGILSAFGASNAAAIDE
uniref:Uncharacterized protein n=1 Tax=Aureoumbra lagunensis TaxID=44058 RepID=A0A7S3JQN3_9STRA|mmetsp:Transcript_18421/g.23965  ORF Transcript_18421/g.23965 Transcript_18421/m.23965 type:complete len:217 (+) Transcript_18421:50-700(+)|eukprot:CAMPEP_0197308646 /NCGR_PEP_ID=MMETSP0891-20130614/7091_1 /TAXON_ID=44058 ORGANISM="Aureoumbra lagunensis, Strain CCMP1510" /NCGR_SAMPLE_ID=MMETSP0891 /ASSEMBLY_ACC=CAM_ASM_000534 /LENGTH=216 /DNA_ID=CAMNT_0042793195 /DNA_START=37 /DNA_END=687 /DNA_ORIENTATION=-